MPRVCDPRDRRNQTKELFTVAEESATHAELEVERSGEPRGCGNHSGNRIDKAHRSGEEPLIVLPFAMVSAQNEVERQRRPTFDLHPVDR